MEKPKQLSEEEIRGIVRGIVREAIKQAFGAENPTISYFQGSKLEDLLLAAMEPIAYSSTDPRSVAQCEKVGEKRVIVEIQDVLNTDGLTPSQLLDAVKRTVEHFDT